MDHSTQQEEQVVSQNNPSWGRGVLLALWYLWIAIIGGVSPVYPTSPAVVHVSDQAEKKKQIKAEIETVITKKSVSQAHNEESRKPKPELWEESRIRDLDTDSEICQVYPSKITTNQFKQREKGEPKLCGFPLQSSKEEKIKQQLKQTTKIQDSQEQILQ